MLSRRHRTIVEKALDDYDWITGGEQIEIIEALNKWSSKEVEIIAEFFSDPFIPDFDKEAALTVALKWKGGNA